MMESQREECLQAEISETKSAEVFVLHGQVSHVEMLNVLIRGTNRATIWSVIACYVLAMLVVAAVAAGSRSSGS